MKAHDDEAFFEYHQDFLLNSLFRIDFTLTTSKNTSKKHQVVGSTENFIGARYFGDDENIIF